MSSPSIVVCRCAHTDLVPAPVLHTVLAALESAHPGGVEVVDDLCGLCARGDERLAKWAAGPLAVFACFDRAVRWLFDWAGAPLAGERVKVLNMRTGTAEEILTAFRILDFGFRIDGKGEEASGDSLQSAIRNPQSEIPPSWVPWFPVVDYSRCRHCRKCANFCLFGVYSIDEEKVRVARPASCKTNCPACARLCPHAAIMFPKYNQPPINGAEVTPENIGRENVGNELLPQAGGDVLEMLRKRAEQASPRSDDRPATSEIPDSVQRILDGAKRKREP
ncbi:MAG: hypothetical protein PHU85_15325 [Phycisphaerae bacterium]|nr:hypothetical protein [Phycisphaerae bacterium]